METDTTERITYEATEDGIDGRLLTVDYFFKSGFIPTTRDTIHSDVQKSSSLGWSWSVANSGVYHTAIVLHLDGEPRYSVNWGPKSATSALQLVREVEGEITYGIEVAGDESVTYKKTIGTINIDEVEEGRKIAEILDRLLTFEKKMYHLVHCNCRDHVLHVLSDMDIGKDELVRLKCEINDVRPAPEWFLKLASQSDQ